MRRIYYIGGSPCCGKSTFAEMIVAKYGFRYFKVDDFLEDYIARGVGAGKPLISEYAGMTLDEIWLRDPTVQNDEERKLYREMFAFVQEDLRKLTGEAPIVTEGAAFLPELMGETGVGKSNYICVVPTHGFQYETYFQRPWVTEYLAGCSDQKRAFENWMKRDYLFADMVLWDAERRGYATLVVDGTKSAADNFSLIETVFNLSK
mgnify:CR=1 FL=1